MFPSAFGEVRDFTCDTTASTSLRIGGVFSPSSSSIRTMSCEIGRSQANCGSLSNALSISLLVWRPWIRSYPARSQSSSVLCRRRSAWRKSPSSFSACRTSSTSGCVIGSPVLRNGGACDVRATVGYSHYIEILCEVMKTSAQLLALESPAVTGDGNVRFERGETLDRRTCSTPILGEVGGRAVQLRHLGCDSIC